MREWGILFAGGLLTFGMRLSFIYMHGRYELPSTIRRALRYVPPAILSAIVAPALLMPNGTIQAGFDNIGLLAGVVAIVVAWFTRNMLVTIIVGMAALVLLQIVIR